jgi:hypothetical protein
VEPGRRYDLYVSLITACNTTCALAGLYFNEVFEAAVLSGPPTSISSYVIVCPWTALLSRQALMTG